MSVNWIWVIIPVTAILVGAFKDWLRFRATTERLGVSTDALEDKVRELEVERERLQRRVENLEAIVTSRLWNVAREADPSPTDKARLDIALGSVPEELPPEQRIERLAEKMGV